MNIEEYLNAVGEQIRCKAARGPVQDEIRCHIEDQKDAFLHEGMNEQEAEQAAVREMGDPVETGVALDGIHRPKMAWGMIALIVGLSIVGFVVQFSMKANLGMTYPYQITKHFVILIISLCAMMGVCYLDYTRLLNYAKLKLAGALFILILFLVTFGLRYNGARVFIHFARITINVKLVMPLLAPLYAAVLYTYRGQGYKALAKALLWILPALYITMTIPSVTYTLSMFLIFISILMFAVYKDWFRLAKMKVLLTMTGFLLLLPVITYGGVMGFGMDYQKMRLQYYIQILLNPSAMADGMGYQTLAIRDALQGSQMLGESLDALEKYQKIPELGDYVLVYMISYYGILIGIIVMGAIVFLISRMFRASVRQKNQLGMLVGFGCCSAFFVQILFYILSNMGMTLFASTYCPFITYGGSGMIVSYILLGILLSIYRYQNVVPISGRISGKSSVRIRLVIEKNE